MPAGVYMYTLLPMLDLHRQMGARLCSPLLAYCTRSLNA